VLESSLAPIAGKRGLLVNPRRYSRQVATAILAFDGAGHAGALTGELRDYTAVSYGRPDEAPRPPKPEPEQRVKQRKPGSSSRNRRELEGIEALIEAGGVRKWVPRRRAGRRRICATLIAFRSWQRETEESGAGRSGFTRDGRRCGYGD